MLRFDLSMLDLQCLEVEFEKALYIFVTKIQKESLFLSLFILICIYIYGNN